MDIFFKELGKTNSLEESIAHVKKVLLKRKLELNIIKAEYDQIKDSFDELNNLILKEEILCKITGIASVMKK